jgi:anti-anti-sigma factor
VHRGDGRRLVLRGELDVAAASALSDAIGEILDSGGSITLDLHQVTFIDSTGLRTIIGAARDLEGRGPLVLERPSPRVVEVLDIAGIVGKTPNLVLKENGEPEGTV